MPMLTARLSDPDMARLKEIAAKRGQPVSEVLRAWIAAEPEAGAPVHAACDAKIAALEAELAAAKDAALF